MVVSCMKMSLLSQRFSWMRILWMEISFLCMQMSFSFKNIEAFPTGVPICSQGCRCLYCLHTIPIDVPPPRHCRPLLLVKQFKEVKQKWVISSILVVSSHKNLVAKQTRIFQSAVQGCTINICGT